MKRIIVFFILITMVTAVLSGSIAYASPSYDQLAQYWAPEIYQDTNSTYSYQADYITSFHYKS